MFTSQRSMDSRKFRVYMINKQTGKISYVTCYREEGIVLTILNMSKDFSYVTNDADILVEVRPLSKGE